MGNKIKITSNVRTVSEIESTIPHINFETNPPSPMINVVCKYLRQFVGTLRFGVATLPISCNIE